MNCCGPGHACDFYLTITKPWRMTSAGKCWHIVPLHDGHTRSRLPVECHTGRGSAMALEGVNVHWSGLAATRSAYDPSPVAAPKAT